VARCFLALVLMYPVGSFGSHSFSREMGPQSELYTD
jgi:hypothetical protein